MAKSKTNTMRMVALGKLLAEKVIQRDVFFCFSSPFFSPSTATMVILEMQIRF